MHGVKTTDEEEDRYTPLPMGLWLGKHRTLVKDESFSVNVVKARFKFNAAHFIAYKNFRERLHGHNYQVGLQLFCGPDVNHDGYSIDFTLIKKVVTEICRSWNEYVIVPLESDCLKINIDKDKQCVDIEAEDGAEFRFPLSDCQLMPIRHSSVEELARYLSHLILQKFSPEYLTKRGVVRMEVMAQEAAGQSATYRCGLICTEATSS